MSMLSLLIVAAASTFAVIWLVHYVPIIATRPKTIWLTNHPKTNKFCILPSTINIAWSPKLFICKLLVPFDVGITLFLVFAGMLGLTTMVTGISMMVFNVLTAVGWSVGVGIIHKFLRPRWKRQFEEKKQEWELTHV